MADSILVLCNTYFQLIVAIQMRLTFLNDKKVVLVMSDHSLNAETIVHKCEREKIFDNVCFIKTRHFCQERMKNKYKVKCLVDEIIGNCYCPELQNECFDSFFYYNDDDASLALYAYFYGKNDRIACYRFEEGIGSYNSGFHYFKKTRLVGRIRSMMKKKNLYDSTCVFYCFQTKLYNGHLEAREIPRIVNNGKLGEILRRLFLDESVDYGIKEKFIFLGSPFDKEGGEPIGEHRLVCEISKLVGKSNLIVKTHPRDLDNEYKKCEISVYEYSSVPWEILQLFLDFSDKVLLTAASTSPLSLNTTIEKPIKTFYLYRLCDVRKNNKASGIVDLLEMINEKNSQSLEEYRIYSPKTIEDIMK